MNKEQRERFQRGGWKLGTVGELFELTPAEEALVETKVKLGRIVRSLRQRSGLSQAELPDDWSDEPNEQAGSKSAAANGL